jgi:hypothetical protein
VSGRVDRIDQRGDDLVVVGTTRPGRAVLTTDDARGSLALALYALAAARTLRRTCVRVELHHLPTGASSPSTTPSSRWPGTCRVPRPSGEEAVAAAEELLAGGDPEALFPARPGPRCGWCDYARACPAAGARPLRPWDGLAEEREAP